MASSWSAGSRVSELGGKGKDAIPSPSPSQMTAVATPPSRVMSPASSDAGSITSSVATGRRDSLNAPSRRLGSLQGAGLSSLSLALGADHGYTAGSSLTGFNAISTLLNNPNKSSRPIDPSSSRYPAISQSHTEIPKVKKSDYDNTINSLKAEWDRFQRNQKLGIRGRARIEGEEVNGDIGDITITEDQRKVSQSIEEEDISKRALGKRRLPPLSTVPQVFFSEDFDLGNPYTFDLVTERYKAASSSSNGNTNRNGSIATGYDVALNQMLQEKLSYYSDVVEQHLILEISARSSSFFAALGNLKDLEAESRSCLSKVEELKKELDERDEGIAKAGLTLIREQAKRRETVERLEAVGLMNQLCEKRDLCQLLVQNNEWSEALDVIENLKDILQGKTKLVPRLREGIEDANILPPHVDIELSNIAAVQALEPQLAEMQNNVSSQLEIELLNILSSDLESRVGRPQVKTAKDPSNIDPSMKAIASDGNVEQTASENNGMQTLTQDEETLVSRIEAHLKGLVRTQGIDRLMVSYKEAILKEVRRATRTFLRDAYLQDDQNDNDEESDWLDNLATLLEDDEAAQGKADAKLGPGGLESAGRLQKLPHEQFLRLLRTLLRGLTALVSGVDTQRRVFIKVLDDEARRKQKSSTDSSEESQLDIVMPNGVSPSLPSTMASMIADVCSATHVLVSRLLSLRSSTHTTLTLNQFLGVFHLAWTFILESEGICGRMIVGLRGVVLNQAKAWLANFHKTRIERAAKAVEEEQWGQAEVTEKQNSDIALVISSATSDPEPFKMNKDAIQSLSLENTEEDSTLKSKTLTIEDKQFFVVSATLDVLEMLVEYLQVIINLPLLSTEIMGRVVEFLKQFNSRTCQVVLGAGAMRSAGLKNITAKHLALASQSLSIMILLIPYIREAVRRHLNPRQAVMLVEFDKLKRDYQEHQYEIHSKLVAIMSDRLTVHCRSLSNIDWAAPLEENTEVVAVKPMVDLVKETTTLHKVLCKYLQPSVVEGVIGQVLISIDKRIATEVRKVETHDENTVKRINAIREHFNEKFGTLKHVDWIIKDLDEAIEEVEKIPDPPAAVESIAKKSLDETNPISPTRTSIGQTSYTPRLSLFARKQQQQQKKDKEQAVTDNSRKSMDSKPSLEARPSEDVIVATEPTSVTEVLGEQKISNEETIQQDEIEKDQSDDAKNTPRQSSEIPPATPSKDLVSDLIGTYTPTPTKAPIKTQEQPPTEIDVPASAQSTSEPAPATPLKDRVISIPNNTDNPATPPSSASAVFSPTTGRMTLQQRLAEAARKRAQAGSHSGSRPSTPLKADSEQVSTTDQTEVKSKEQVEDVQKEAVKIEIKEEAKEEPEPEKEAVKVESNEGEPKEDAREEMKEEPKREVEETAAEEVKEEAKIDSTEEIKADSTDVPQVEVKEEQKQESQDTPLESAGEGKKNEEGEKEEINEERASNSEESATEVNNKTQSKSSQKKKKKKKKNKGKSS